MKRNLLIKICFSVVFCAASAFTNGQTINTFAGTGFMGNTGNGGPATAATLGNPTDVAVDGGGNVYIADYEYGTVRVVNASGNISIAAGGGTSYPTNGAPATSVFFESPVAIACDASGNLYITDQELGMIYKVNTSGILNIVAGNGGFGFLGDGGPATAASFYYPGSLAVDGSGNLYIADQDDFRVRIVNTSGIINTFAGNGLTGGSSNGVPATSAAIGYVTGLAVDNSGNVYIAEPENSRVQVVNTSGIINNFAGNGTAGFSGDGSSATAAELYNPTFLSTDAAGNVFISEPSDFRIRGVDHNGVIHTVAGTGVAGSSGDGGPATAATLDYPGGIANDNMGNCYVAEEEGSKVRVFQSFIGPGNLCIGSTYNMDLSISGGTWSSSNPSIASVSATGVVSALRWGTDTIIYSFASGALKAVVTVDTTWAGNLTGRAILCYNGIDTLFTEVAGGTWSSVNGLVYFTGDGVFQPLNSGLDVVQYTVNNSCGTYMASFPINIVPLPPSGAISGSDSICVDHTVPYSESVAGGVWSVIGSGISVTSSGEVTVSAVGIDAVVYTVTNMCGTQTVYYPIAVLATPDCHFINAVAVVTPKQEDFSVSPNPSNGKFVLNLVSDNDLKVTYTLTNTIGAVISTITGETNHEIEINSGIVPGIYYVSATVNGVRLNKKVVVY